MSLLWNPAVSAIENHCRSGNRLVACISAFATVDAIDRLLHSADKDNTYVITRWRVSELKIGVSDLAVYEHLRHLGIPLYINYRLHSKIYQFSDGSMICGSCNATSPGLGLCSTDSQNIETACLIEKLTLVDGLSLKRLRDTSLRVNESVYEHFREAVNACPPPPPLQTRDIKIYEQHMDANDYLLSDLPTTSHPSRLIAAIQSSDWHSNAFTPQMLTDCVTFGVTDQMSCSEAIAQLESGFKSSPFVIFVTEEIRREGSMRFGAVTSLVHSHCRDVPTPYRSDVKAIVENLYNWLCHYFDDLSWDIPGARSQVIRTNRPS